MLKTSFLLFVLQFAFLEHAFAVDAYKFGQIDFKPKMNVERRDNTYVTPLSLKRKTCGKQVDLNKTSVLKDMAVLDQDGSGTCWAYAASQIIEFELRKRKVVSEQISTVDLARFVKDENLTGGNESDMFDSVNDNGVIYKRCEEKAIQKYSANKKLTTEQIVAILDAEYYYRNLSEKQKKMISGDNAVLNASGIQSDVRTCDYLEFNKAFKQINSDVSTTVRFLKKTLASCDEHRIKTPKLAYDVEEFGSSSVMQVKMNSLLDRDHPAILSICANTLFDTDKLGVNRRTLWNVNPISLFAGEFGHPQNGCRGNKHAVLVVAKKDAGDGKCEYLLRNSWGGGWRNAGKNRCACKTPDGTYYENCDEIDDKINAMLAAGKDYRSLAEQRSRRVMVGCWFGEDALLGNTLKVGGVLN